MLALTLLGMAAGAAQAKVSAAEAGKLGTSLTCTGAEKAGNADGSIPAFSGKWLGAPDGVSYKNNVEKPDGAYHNLADKLTYIRYKAIPTYPLFNKKNQQLADDYDKAYKQLEESGKILELEQKYFGEDVFQYVKD